MRPLASLLALPSSVLLLLCASPSSAIAEQSWPHNLPRHMKYFPEDEANVRRSLDIQERLKREEPVGVKKMSTDEGEMFMFDNWIFEGDVSPDSAQNNRRMEAIPEHGDGNSSIVVQAFSPLRPHSASLDNPMLRFAVRDVLMNRGFKCPDGTNDCSSIGQPNSCCSASDTCITIPDSGYGTVGCCPKGVSCSGSISCDTAHGYTSCPNSPNGGCCLPGYNCLDIGCVVSGTSTAIVVPSQSSTPAPAPSSATSTAVVVVPTTPSSSSPPSSSAPPSASSAYSCSTGWFSCPASLGGGCCQSGLACASGALCSGSSTIVTPSSASPSAPVRPTSVNSNSAVTTSSSAGPSLCPTGFYVCSAYYPSGCCRVGRDCQTSGSCIPLSTSIIVSNGVTIGAPGASFATTGAGQGGSCPSAWFSCAASLGGNCCPSGYSCGEQCTGTGSGQTSVSPKIAPSTASNVHALYIWTLFFGAGIAGLGMIIL